MSCELSVNDFESEFLFSIGEAHELIGIVEKKQFFDVLTVLEHVCSLQTENYCFCDGTFTSDFNMSLYPFIPCRL